MPFIATINDTQRDNIRAGGYNAKQYILPCPNTIVFQAQVNQSTTNSSFADIAYDGVTTGTYTDVKEGFTVYIGDSSGDIRSASFVGRIRKPPTAQKLYINQTSAEISDNQYIMVVKDVRLWFKLPRIADDVIYRDYDVTFRKLLPAISGLQTAYAGVMSGGNADFAFTPSAVAMEDGSSISSWLWDADGGSFQVGSSSSQNVTIRYTTAGHYMPRLKVTDNGGRSNWITFHVFVIPADYSSVVDTAYTPAQITSDVDSGWGMQISAFAGVDDIADNTFVALYAPGQLTALTSDIRFIGRFRQEQNRLEIINGGYATNSQFTMEGVAQQLNNLNGTNTQVLNASDSSEWGQIDKMTPIRAAWWYLSEHTTLSNICSISWHDTGDTYNYKGFPIEQNSVGETIRALLQKINARLEHAPQGEIRSTRETWMLTNRSSVTTILDMGFADVDATDSGVYDINRDPKNTVGLILAGGGTYRAADDNVQGLRAITPAVTPTEGDFQQQLNGQILAANTDIGSSFIELGGRSANYFARVQPLTTLNIQLMDGYHELIPSVSDRYSWTIPAMQDPRGVGYSTNDYWQLTNITISYDHIGGRYVDATFTRETAGDGYQTLTQIPLTQTDLANPVMPTAPPYDYSPPPIGVFLPDPTNPNPLDIPIVKPTDPSPANPNPQDIDQQRKQGGDYGLAWSTGAVYEVKDINLSNTPTFNNVTPSQVTETIKDAKFDKVGKNVYVLEQDSSNNLSWVYRTKALGQLAYIQSELDGLYSMLRPTYETNKVYAYGEANAGITNPYYSGDGDIPSPYTLETGITGYPSAPAPTYNAIEDRIEGTSATSNASVGFRLTKTFSGQTMSAISLTIAFRSTRGPATSADIQINGSTVATQSSGASTGTITVNWTGSSSVTSIRLRGLAQNVNDSDGSYCYLTKASWTIGTSSGDIVTVYSIDGAALFGSPVLANAAGNVAGADVLFPTTRILLSANSIVRDATDGGSYSDTTGGGSGEPLCIATYGDDTLKYLYATSTTLYKYDGSTNDITPNDGVSDGLAVGANCLAVARGIETHYVCVLSFGGVRKIAYTVDGGSNWSFNTQIGNSATYVRMKYVSAGIYHVMVIEASSMWYAAWNGEAGTLTFSEKTAPATLTGFEWYE